MKTIPLSFGIERMQCLVRPTVLLALACCLPGPAGAEDNPEDEYGPGVTLRVYHLEYDLERLVAVQQDQTPNLDEVRPTIDFRGDEPFGTGHRYIIAQATGDLIIPEAGRYQFRLSSDDGSRLSLNGEQIVDNDGNHGMQAVESEPIQLDAGHHPLVVDYFDHGGTRALRLEWRRGADGPYRVIPESALRTQTNVTRVVSDGFKLPEGIGEPGDGLPLESVHPAWRVQDINPEGFEPRVGAMAFLPDGRLVVGTFEPMQRNSVELPDIDAKEPDRLYAISNLDGDGPTRMTPIADGLYEPAGLCVVDGDLYVGQRGQITKLTDPDGDGYFDTHETIASGWEGWNYHQFTFGPVHRDGYLYAATSTAMAPPDWEGMDTNAAPNGPYQGVIVRVNLETGEQDYIAGGMRTPNGIGFGPQGILLVSDNQGTWRPANTLHLIEPGTFHGHYNSTNVVPNLADRYPEGGHPSLFADRPVTPPILYLPQNECANSPTTPLLIEQGPWAGQLLLGELTGGGIRRVSLEKVDGAWQGVVFRFTQGLSCGVNRLAWGPDGHLYVGGMGAKGNWNWRDQRFGLERLVQTDQTTFEFHDITATPDGFELTFSTPVDPDSVGTRDAWQIAQWTYEPTARYGGRKIDSHDLAVESVRVDADGRTVRLVIPGLKEGYCVHLRADAFSATGEPMWSPEAWYTLHRVPGR